MKRWLYRLSFVLLTLGLLWALFNLVENWRGRRAWEAWKGEQESRGARYDLAGLLPAPPPDGDNFAKAPAVQALLDRPEEHWLPDGFHFVIPKSTAAFRPNWETGHALDLKPWQDANGTQDLAAALAPAGAFLDQLSEASRRPACRFGFPVSAVDDPLFPPVIRFRHVARLLSLRTLLRLRAGQADLALQDLLAQLRIVRHLAADPAFSIQLAQLANSGMAMQGLWEGLSTHAWNAEQLAALQEELGKMDELTPFLRLGRAERVNLASDYGAMLAEPWWNKGDAAGKRSRSIATHLLEPRGWIYQNWRHSDEYYAETWLRVMDPDGHRVYPEHAAEMQSWWARRHATPYSFVSKSYAVVGPGITNQAQRFAARQATLDEAFVVCALERWRLEHKAYPDSLGALVPGSAAKLPPDLFNGASLRYKRDGDSFQLYSVGWNGRDEGGASVTKGLDQDLNAGDWPWPQPAH